MGQLGGEWLVSFDTAVSLGLNGGHAEDMGLSPGGAVIPVTPHRHVVNLDLYRFELGISYAINDAWDAALRVPYFIKDQRASIEFPAGAPAADLLAAQANANIHHRTETYRGFGDLELMAGWRKQHVFGSNTVARVSLGVTLPTGATEADPLTAGAAGLRHLHIQFGNGTVDPLLDFYLGRPVSPRWGLSLYGKARLPFYENSQGYRGALEGLLAPRVTWLPHRRISASAGVAGGAQGFTHWNGVRDPNSGQLTVNSILSVGGKLTEQTTVSFSYLHPIYTRALGGEDEFKGAPTFSLAVGFSF